MYYEITPHHNNDADSCVLPADTEEQRAAACEYAQARIEDAWDQLQVGNMASVTIELCVGDMPQIDTE